MKDQSIMGADRDTKAPVLPDVAVDNKANAAKFKEKWAERRSSDGKTRVHLPGTRRSVEMSHVEVADNVISVWTSTDKSAAPDFVIVNAPTEVTNDHGVSVEDHLTAVALVIDGVTK